MTSLMEFLAQRRGAAAELARHLRVPAPWLSQMASGVRPVPPNLAPQIEAWTERSVRRWQLRPDDWHLIWPELVGTDGAPAVPVSSAAAGTTEAAAGGDRLAA